MRNESDIARLGELEREESHGPVNCHTPVTYPHPYLLTEYQVKH